MARVSPTRRSLTPRGSCRCSSTFAAESFRLERLPQEYGRAVALAVGDQDADSVFDILVLSDAGVVTRVSRSSRDGTWRETLVIARRSAGGLQPGVARLLTADLDNNGATDLLVTAPSATRVLLGWRAARIRRCRTACRSAFTQRPTWTAMDGSSCWASIRPDVPVRAISPRDQDRIDGRRFGRVRRRRPAISGSTRSGSAARSSCDPACIVQKQVITSPVVHFGLGEAARAEVARITWPNGVLQAEFDTPGRPDDQGDQRLKGSCPWLFAWNGREMAFVTDLLWRSPLGLRINAQATADMLMTEDWVKVRGDQLAARDGAYDLRITAELWETHFFDLVSLLVVDHPAGTEVFVDERFAVPPPPLQGDRDRSGAAVRVGRRRSRRAICRISLRAPTHGIVDFAGRGRVPGHHPAHFVELELPRVRAAQPGRSGSSRRDGSIRPTARSTSPSARARSAAEGLSLQVADADGRFREVAPRPRLSRRARTRRC